MELFIILTVKTTYFYAPDVSFAISDCSKGQIIFSEHFWVIQAVLL